MVRKFFELRSLSAAALVAVVFGAPVHAATVTFSNFQHVGSDAVDYIVTIADDSEAGVTAGNFKVSYQVNTLSSYTTAKLTGFFFDAADPFVANNSPYNAGNLGLMNETTPLSCGQGFNTDQVSAGGCSSTLNLGADAGVFQNHLFDVGIAWQNGNDLSNGAVGMFEISDLGFLTLDDWAAVGLRGQATTGPGGSAKEFQIMADTAVPVPAAVWLFGSGLLGLVGIARRRRS